MPVSSTDPIGFAGLIFSQRRANGLKYKKVQHSLLKAAFINIFFNNSTRVTVVSPNSLDLGCGRRPTHEGAALFKTTVTVHRPDGQKGPAASPGELQTLPPRPQPYPLRSLGCAEQVHGADGSYSCGACGRRSSSDDGRAVIALLRQRDGNTGAAVVGASAATTGQAS